MKRKFGMTAAAVLLALSLTACSNNKNQSSSSSTSSNSSSSQVSKKSADTNKASSNSDSNKPSSQAPKQNRMDSLTASLRKVFPDMLLPTQDGLGTGSDNLNVRYTKAANKNVVYYSVGNSAQNFNAASLANEKPFAVLTETKNVSSADAEDLINYMPAQSGLPTKQLDANTKATSQGAAGSTYLQWNKNNYSFVVQANNQLKQNPMSTAKKLLSLVNSYGVPTTATKGSVTVKVGESVGSLNTVITWKNGNNVYQLKAHDTETALKMLASLK